MKTKQQLCFRVVYSKLINGKVEGGGLESVVWSSLVLALALGQPLSICSGKLGTEKKKMPYSCARRTVQDTV